MDNNLEYLRIKSYGIGVTTLEEVFLKVGDGVGIDEKFNNSSINQNEEEQNNDAYCLVDESVTGLSLEFLQLKKMISARIKLTLREPRAIFMEILLPTFLIIVSALLLGLSLGASDGIYQMSLSRLPSDLLTTISYPEDTMSRETAERFMNRFYGNEKFNSVLIEGSRFKGNTYLETAGNFDDYVMKNGPEGWRIFSVIINRIEEINDVIYYDITTLVDPNQKEAIGYAILANMNSIFRDVINDNDAEFSLGRGTFPRIAVIDDILNMVMILLTVLNFSITLGLVTSSFAGNIVKEREDSLKHQQIVSGGSKFSYWVSMFITDILKFILPVAAFIGLVFYFGIELPLFWLFLILTILAILPMTYFFTFILRKESLARNIVRMIHIFLGGFLAILVYGLSFTEGTYKLIAGIVRYGMSWNPTFVFSHGMVAISSTKVSSDSAWSKFTFQDAGGDLFFLVLEIFVFWGLIILIENKFYVNRVGRAVRMEEENVYQANNLEENVNLDDPDVKEEEQRVANLTPNDLEIRTYLLNKVYNGKEGEKHVVKNVSFGISFGECFALLGINGAGKTTTFKALTGDIEPTSGEVNIGGYDVQNRIEYSSIRNLIGYCPQFDALFPNLSVKEHLEFYAHIKGVVPRMRNTVVERQLIEMGLEQYKSIYAGKLSGGNKRKLSVAMAMIGNPPIVFLDEPSTGMDPKAKRFMWNIIAKISTLRKKSCVILTTHSMEEAEALSTKLGIMVDGSFKCFGSAQHIKNKFGDGYEVEIKITIPSTDELLALARQNG